MLFRSCDATTAIKRVRDFLDNAATIPSASWAASGVTAGLTLDPETIDVATTDGTTVAVPVLLGGILTVSGGGLPAGTQIAVTWASALYAVEAAPVLTRGTDAFACFFDAPPLWCGRHCGPLRVRAPHRCAHRPAAARRLPLPHQLLPHPPRCGEGLLNPGG